jgi:hypothetical protein
VKIPPNGKVMTQVTRPYTTGLLYTTAKPLNAENVAGLIYQWSGQIYPIHTNEIYGIGFHYVPVAIDAEIMEISVKADTLLVLRIPI